MNKSKNIVIIGGSGFLGSYLYDELLRRQYTPIVADKVKSKYIREEHFVNCDLTDIESLDAAIPHDAEYVYNFAGLANLDEAAENPIQTFDLNVQGNLRVLQVCRNRPEMKRFIYASSAYALSDKGSFYGISKIASEKNVEEYYRRYGLCYTIIRYGSVYGERDFKNNYIYCLLKEVISEGKIAHKGDGTELREYIHASDTAKLSVDIIEDDGKYTNERIILTGVEKFQRLELFNMIREILGQSIKIELSNDGYFHHYKYMPYSFHPTVSKKLVPNPYIDIGQGIVECIQNIYINMRKQ